MRIPVPSTEIGKLSGFQMSIKGNGVRFNAVESGDLNMKDNHHIAGDDRDVLNICWNTSSVNSIKDADTLFFIEIEAVEAGLLSELMEIDEARILAEAVKQDMRILPVELKYSSDKNVAVLLYNEPNPFSSSTKIYFEVASEGNGEIVVYDLFYREVDRFDIRITKGLNVFEYNPASALKSGVYLYELNVGGFSITKKMIYAD